MPGVVDGVAELQPAAQFLQQVGIETAPEFLPADVGRTESIFSARGAYSRFKDMLEHRNALDRWYDYENTATETALRDLVDRYRLLVDLSPDAIVVHQMGIVRFVNPAGVEFVQLASAERASAKSCGLALGSSFNSSTRLMRSRWAAGSCFANI